MSLNEGPLLWGIKYEEIRKMIVNSDLQPSDVNKLRESLLAVIETPNLGYEAYLALGLLDLLEARVSREKKLSCLESAENNFQLALSKEENIALPHYGLFKIAIARGDYEEAYKELKIYDSKEQGKKHNFALLYGLLNRARGVEEEITIGNGEYVQITQIQYEPLLSNYHLAEQAFQNCDYQRVLKHLKICQELAYLKKIAIDMSTMIHLTRELYENQRTERKMGLMSKYTRSNDIGNRMMLANQLLRLDSQDLDCYFAVLDCYIDLKAYTPLPDYLAKMHTLPATTEQKEMLGLYQRLVYEKTLESSHILEINQIIDIAKALIAKGDYELALVEYQKGYNLYRLPSFKVRIAELCYELKAYESAKKYLLEYLAEGYDEMKRASILLYKIYMRENNSSDALGIAFNCYRKCHLQERGTPLGSFEEELRQAYFIDVLGETNFQEEEKKVIKPYHYCREATGIN